MDKGYCSFLVKGHGIKFKELEEQLEIKSTQIFKEGEINSKVIGKNKFDLMRFDLKIEDEKTPDEILNNLTDKLISKKSIINKLKKGHSVNIKCFVQSDLAQINYKISSKVLKKLANLELDFEVSIISWGMAE